MRVFTRYILGEVISHAAIGTAVFTFVIFMRDMPKIMELVVRNSAPIGAVAKIFAYTLPVALTFSLPIGVLVGILIGLSRLAADSEVTAIRASGQGAWLFVRVVLIFAVGAWLFALGNSLYVSPAAAKALANLQERLATSQVSFEVQPRVFYENISNYVLYLQDVRSARGAAAWRGIFLADVSTPAAPRIIMAEKGVVVSQDPTTLLLHLENGARHEMLPRNQQQYDVNAFQASDFSIPLPGRQTKDKKPIPPTPQLSTPEMLYWARSDNPDIARWYGIELQRRLAVPTACLMMALVGIPLGLSSRRGGKSTGFVLAILLVGLYYFLLIGGISLARNARVPVWAGPWLGNAVAFVAGLILIWRVDRTSFELPLRSLRARIPRRKKTAGAKPGAVAATRDAFSRAIKRRRLFSAQFPLLIDDYILKNFAAYLTLIISGFLMLTLVFTVFEILGDALRNATILVVAEYILHLIPGMLYLIMPLAVMLAVLVTFGILSRTSEVTAMKATGISVYRIILPVLVIAAILAAGLFFFDQLYLPQANRRQEALRNRIEGRPPQTYLNPGRKWIFGQERTIYYYEFYDPDQNRFANFTAFEFDPQSFQIKKRIFGTRVHWEPELNKWVFENGWTRSFSGSNVEDYRTYDVATFEEMKEEPTYFKKELKQSQEMNYEELRRYIQDLQQAGFDVTRLRVQLHRKFAYPVITFVMAVLAVPFSVASARRGGAVAGVAIAVGVSVLYWMIAGLFEAMGNVNQLPPALAAWSPDLIFGLAGGYLITRVPT